MHQHICPNCKMYWWHENKDPVWAENEDVTCKEFEEALCERCLNTSKEN